MPGHFSRLGDFSGRLGRFRRCPRGVRGGGWGGPRALGRDRGRGKRAPRGVFIPVAFAVDLIAVTSSYSLLFLFLLPPPPLPPPPPPPPPPSPPPPPLEERKREKITQPCQTRVKKGKKKFRCNNWRGIFSRKNWGRGGSWKI